MKNVLLLIYLLFSVFGFSQKQKQLSSSEIYAGIQKLKVQGRILYLAAHPDDENTKFIAYCANSKKLKTAYMSLTRGDGGQNLIGPELREELGLIRTQELFMARKLDGGQQFFSRANDFGYSKNPEETFSLWNKELVLGDLIFVIRSFRPDVIICRFPSDGRGGHGHHTASAILGAEAFNLAADPNAYPQHFALGVSLWQATRIVTNTGKWWNDKISTEDPHVVAENIGEYEVLSGTSCNEIAALSRSQHKSQGFGTTGTRGEQIEYFEHVDGKEAENSLFDGLDLTWGSIKGGHRIGKRIDKILSNFEINHPENSIIELLDLRKRMEALTQDIKIFEKIQELNQLILQCGGFYAEAKISKAIACQGDSLLLNIEVIARQTNDFKLISIQSDDLNWIWNANIPLVKNKIFEHKKPVKLSTTIAPSQQYWLKEKGTLGSYILNNQELVMQADNGSNSSLVLRLQVNGEIIQTTLPLVYKENDPVKGEVYTPFNIVPNVSIQFKKENLLVKNNEEQLVQVSIKSFVDNFEGGFHFELPYGWKINNVPESISLEKVGDEKIIDIHLLPEIESISGPFSIKIIDKTKIGVSYTNTVKFIEYEHIPTQLYLSEAKIQLSILDIKRVGNLVGYVEGAGDEITEALNLVGYQVDIIKEADLNILEKYDAIILGIRALNTNDRIGVMMPKLLEYVKNGGNLIVQYNTNQPLKTENFSPYPLKIGRDRVTDETAEVTFLVPDHPVLNFPNKITFLDFDGWVQERGLYFPTEWDEDYTPILACNDNGETSKTSLLLIAKYGKGNYIYTGLSFFRELPAGVPGAYRLFVNLISLGNE